MLIVIDDLEKYDIESLRRESTREGYNLINRLDTEYRSGENRFDKKGEKLVGYQSGNTIVAVCGLNIEPTNSKLGRIRRLYVLPGYRHRQIGTELVKYLINHATQHFEGVLVNIGDLPVGSFYESMGFSPGESSMPYTHLYRLP